MSYHPAYPSSADLRIEGSPDDLLKIVRLAGRLGKLRGHGFPGGLRFQKPVPKLRRKAIGARNARS